MALTFVSASSDRVNCGSAAGIDNLTALTVMGWVNPTALAGRPLISKYRGSVPEGWTFEIDGASGFLSFTWEQNTSHIAYVSSSLALTTNTWACIAATADATGAKIYVGSLTANMAETTYSATTVGSGGFKSDAARSLFLGNRDATTPNGGFPGRIGPTLLFNRILTLGEIQSLQFKPRPLSGCRGYWRPGDAGTSSVPDWSGQGNTGTVTGATAGVNPPLPNAFAIDEYRMFAAPPVSATVDVPLSTMTFTTYLPTISGGGTTDPSNWSTATVDYQDGRMATAVLIVDGTGGTHRGGIYDFGNGTYAVAMVDTSIGSGAHHGNVIDFGNRQYGVPVVPIESTGTRTGVLTSLGNGQYAVAVVLVSGSGGQASGKLIDFGDGRYAWAGVQLSGPS